MIHICRESLGVKPNKQTNQVNPKQIKSIQKHTTQRSEPTKIYIRSNNNTQDTHTMADKILEPLQEFMEEHENDINENENDNGPPPPPPTREELRARLHAATMAKRRERGTGHAKTVAELKQEKKTEEITKAAEEQQKVEDERAEKLKHKKKEKREKYRAKVRAKDVKVVEITPTPTEPTTA